MWCVSCVPCLGSSGRQPETTVEVHLYLDARSNPKLRQTVGTARVFVVATALRVSPMNNWIGRDFGRITGLFLKP